MNTFRRLCLCLSAVSLLAAGCEGERTGGTTDPSGGTPSGTSGQSMSARIDGTQWTAVTVTTTRGPITTGLPFGALAVSGTSNVTNRIEITAFSVPAVVGTYTLGPAGGAANPQTASLQNSTTGASWSATATTGSGTVTVSALTLTGATGSFAFNLTPSNAAATGTKVVTEGLFSVTF